MADEEREEFYQLFENAGRNERNYYKLIVGDSTLSLKETVTKTGDMTLQEETKDLFILLCTPTLPWELYSIFENLQTDVGLRKFQMSGLA